MLEPLKTELMNDKFLSKANSDFVSFPCLTSSCPVSDEESAYENEEENDESDGEEEKNFTNLRWSSVIRMPQDRTFAEEFGMKVEIANNSSCLQYFELLFTDDVYQLILDEAIWFERQKRQGMLLYMSQIFVSTASSSTIL